MATRDGIEGSTHRFEVFLEASDDICLPGTRVRIGGGDDYDQALLVGQAAVVGYQHAPGAKRFVRWLVIPR